MKSLSLSFAMILAGAVSGIAGTSVWSYDKHKGNEVQPARWGDVYSQPSGSTAALDSSSNYMEFSTNLNVDTEDYAAAGFSLVWKTSGTIDLSSYSGICLTYKADRPFRVDLKQSTITDYNYYGSVLPAQADFAPVFIDFSKVAQEPGWGDTTVALDLTKQLAIQINYKEGIASEVSESDANRTKNVITVAAVSLGECGSVIEEPSLSVLEPYNKAQTVSVKESETLKIDLKKVFSAGEDEVVSIVTKVSPATLLTLTKPEGDPTLTDELVFTPKAVDEDASGTITITAMSETSEKFVKATFNVTVKDESAVGPTCPGDPECPDDPPANNPPVVLSPYDETAPEVELTEGVDTLKIVLAKLFADEDNDPLTFTVELGAPLMTVLDDVKKLTLKDTLHIITKSVKKDTTFLVTVNATDGKIEGVVKAHHRVTIIDVPNVIVPPAVCDLEYTVNEDGSLSVPWNRGIWVECGQPDGFVVFGPVDSTKHGELVKADGVIIDTMGAFTYTPNKDFYGDDTLTYVFIEREKREGEERLTSAKGTIAIHVKAVNDAPVAKVSDSTFIKDTLVLDMDFDEDTVSQIKIPVKSLSFTDIEVTDGSQKLTYGALGGKKIKAELDSLNKTSYFISVKSVTGASGLDSILVFATDGVDTTGVHIYVKLVSPKDLAQAAADEYTAFKDSTLSVSAKEGVLANDKYPEGVTKGMTAELAQKPAHGTLTLNKDGSFKYTPAEDFEGKDYFGYYCVVNETKSKAVIVTISVEERNMLPTVVVKSSTLDTTVTEDFPSSRPIKYTKATVTSWFKDPEGDPLTYSAKSKDGKLKVEITDKGVLEINSVPDSTGKAYVVVTATDKKSGSKSFEFCVTIKPVNDKPELLHADTAYVSNSGWTVKWDLDTLVVDVDGDELTYSPNETSALSKLVTISMKGSVITVKANSGVKFKDDQKVNVGVKVSDPDKANVTIPLCIIVGEKPAGLMPQLAQPKNNWQNAVMAKRGAVSMMDMQGRVIWKAKLPVNPAEVLNASAKVQGRKILRVNTQTWTIK